MEEKEEREREKEESNTERKRERETHRLFEQKQWIEGKKTVGDKERG